MSCVEMFNFFAVLFVSVFAICVNSYEYANQAKWYDEFKQCQNTKQSPIELLTEESKVIGDLPAIYTSNYDQMYQDPVKVQNNGKTANIILPKPANSIYENPNGIWQFYDRILPQVYGGPFENNRYVADSIHFHWGSEDQHGSEHVIDSQRHSMEMHIVHRNGKYKSVEEAREQVDGLAVLAVLFHAKTENPDYPGLYSVIETLQSVEAFNTVKDIKSFFTLSTLLGDIRKDEYFTYKGSLTTPPCSETVTWVVFPDIIQMSHKQMSEFHELRDAQNHVLENNYRSLQAKGSRKVTLMRKTRA